MTLAVLVSWGEEKTTSFMPLVSTSGKKPTAFSKNGNKPVAAKVLMAAESILHLGRPAQSHKALASAAPSHLRLRGPALPLQLLTSSYATTACGSTGENGLLKITLLESYF